MSFLKFLSFIPHFFASLFQSAKNVWLQLSPQLQNALLHGSGIIATINENLDKVPPVLLEILKAKFPDLAADEEKLKAALLAGAAELKVAEQINSDDLLIMLGNLQAYLGTLTGSVWEKISHTLGLGIALFLAPAGTKLAALSSLIDYVYHDLIKGKAVIEFPKQAA